MKYKKGEPSMNLRIGGIIGLIGFCLLAFGMGMDIVHVKGNEAVVQEHVSQGVLEDVLRAKTHFIVPGIMFSQYKYNIGTQKLTFDSDKGNKGAEYSSIKVNVGQNGGQSAWIPLSINYRIGFDSTDAGPKFNQAKLVALHNDVKHDYQDIIIKRTVVDVVNRIARPQEALEIYSGEGFNEFKKAIEDTLVNHPVFMRRGIFVENVIVYDVRLNPAYEKEIEAKQLAKQKALREKEERKAAEETALKVKAVEQANVEKITQQAEAQKRKMIKDAEAEKAKIVLQSEAEKAKRIAEAEGERDANLAKASGILAVGEAEATVDALKREALYAGDSGAWRAKVEIEAYRAQTYRGMLDGASVLTDKSIAWFGEMSGAQGTQRAMTKLATTEAI